MALVRASTTASAGGGNPTPGSRSARSAVVAGSLGLASLLLAGPLAVPAAAATVVADWRMEDSTRTMRDSSGANRHGTSTSNVLLRQSGFSGYGYRFTDTPSYVTVPSASALNPGTATFSMTAHVKFTALPPGGVSNTFEIIRKGYSTTAGGDWKLEIMSNGAAHCLFRGSSGTGEVYGSRNLADGLWHSVTCKRTSSSVSLTVDGTTRSSVKSTGTISNSTSVMLGAKNTSGHDQYKGYLDKVSLSRG